jgi:hypothetical protein
MLALLGAMVQPRTFAESVGGVLGGGVRESYYEEKNNYRKSGIKRIVFSL